MGTLFNQPKRRTYDVNTNHLRRFILHRKEIAKELEVSLSDVLEAEKLLEMERTNQLYIENGDAFDEQISGIGEILRDIQDVLENKQ